MVSLPVCDSGVQQTYLRWITYPPGVVISPSRARFYFDFAQTLEKDVADEKVKQVIAVLAVFNTHGMSAAPDALPASEWSRYVEQNLNAELGALYLKAEDAVKEEISVSEREAKSHDLRVKRAAWASLRELRSLQTSTIQSAERLYGRRS